MREHNGASADIHRLEGESIEVEILPELGARLHRLRVFGHDLLRTPEDPAAHLHDPFYWGGYHMVPWTNRIAPGQVRVGRQIVDLQSNFKDGTAIHGLHYVTPWRVEAPGSYVASGGGDASGWPWPYEVRVDCSVDDRAVRILHRVTNHADERMPAGAGIHPWFVMPVEVRVPAAEAIASNTDADAPIEPLNPELDFHAFRELPAGLDAAWANVEQPAFALRWPHLGILGEVFASAPEVYVVAANPGSATAVAVEPQSHAPWGLRRLLDGERGGLTWLAPGETLTLESVITFRQTQETQS